MGNKDEWIRSAISDDNMVADFLIRLKHSSSSSSSSSASVEKTSLPLPRWGIQLPRSRMAFRFDAVASSPEKKTDSARNSPTTPLAWSAGGSAASSSGTANGYDESTLPVCPSSDARSKVVGAGVGAADAKKSKRKKIFAGLKEEEGLLLKERVNLEKEIASLRTSFKKHTTTNENLKCMKLDFDFNATNGSTMASDEKEVTASSLEKDSVKIHRTPPTSKNALKTGRSSFCQVSIPAEYPERGFLLPDLNMAPSEDDFTLEGLHGVSRRQSESHLAKS